MKIKIEIEHEDKVFEGTIELLETKKQKTQKNSLKKQTNPYKEGTASFYLYRLIFEDNFFDNNAIKTTEEIVKRIKMKFDKKVQIKKAAQLFAKLVKDGHLERENIIRRGGKGTYIWFLPSLSKKVVENFIKGYSPK